MKTDSGLVVFDGIWPDEKVYEEIRNAISDAGWSDIPVTKFIMTHGHIDHVGCGKWLVDNYNVIQQCIIHQIRNSTKYVSYKDIKALMADLKKVYGAVNEDTALYELEQFSAKWDSKYPKISSDF